MRRSMRCLKVVVIMTPSREGKKTHDQGSFAASHEK